MKFDELTALAQEGARAAAVAHLAKLYEAGTVEGYDSDAAEEWIEKENPDFGENGNLADE